MGLSGYVLAAPWSGATLNYSYPLYYDMGASVQDHFLNWKVTRPSPMLASSLLTGHSLCICFSNNSTGKFCRIWRCYCRVDDPKGRVAPGGHHHGFGSFRG